MAGTGEFKFLDGVVGCPVGDTAAIRVAADIVETFEGEFEDENRLRPLYMPEVGTGAFEGVID